MLLRRWISTAIIAIWLVFLFFLYVPIREDVARLAADLIDSSVELPLLTRDFTLRILGSGNDFSPHENSLFYLFWGVLWAIPLGMLFFVWRIKTQLKLMEFLLLSWLSYLFLCTLLFILALYGLILPFLYR